ncbi:MAG: hypothetical protein QGF72_06155, partial [Candidatus Poseidoniaceae archaeon]|nr:hypothetical protein [Candidatus Poseidoniaceae archaeon]
EQRFEDTKQTIMLSTDSEELENLDLTDFNEYETSRLNALMEQNLEVQRAEKFNQLMREIIMAENFDQVDSIRIVGVSEEQRSSLEEAKEEAIERFHDEMYSYYWNSIDAAQTEEELGDIEFKGVSEFQLQSLTEHRGNRASALVPAEDILDIQSELVEEPLKTMIPQGQPELMEEITTEEVELEEEIEEPLKTMIPQGQPELMEEITTEEVELEGETEPETEESFEDLLMEFGEQQTDDEESEVETIQFDDGEELEELLAAALEGTEDTLKPAKESIEEAEVDADTDSSDEESQPSLEYISSPQILIEKIIVNENILESLNGRLKREGVERAEYEISLMWNNKNDLDIHVDTANGDHIDVNTRTSSCNGILVHSMNARSTSKKPIEHIIWTEKPPTGKYVVSIDHFKKNRGFGTRDPTRFLVAVNIAGNISAWEGHINSNDDLSTICEFTIE